MTLSKQRLRIISQNIRLTRRSRGLTQEEIAEAVNLSLEYYGQIESGNKAPSLETLINIAEYLSVSTDYLIRGSEHNAGLDNITHLLSGKNPIILSKIEKLLYLLLKEFIDD